MLIRYTKIILTGILFLVHFSAYTSVAVNDVSQSGLPALISEIRYFVSKQKISIDSVNHLSDNSFRSLHEYDIQPNETFWLRIVTNNEFAKEKEYFIHFYTYLHEVCLYQKNNRGEWVEHRSGILVPEKLKTVPGFINDKVPFTISDGSETVLYLKIKNRVVKHLNNERIRIVDSKSFYRIEKKTGRLQSFFLGIITILCIFNLLLFIVTKIRIYLFYLLYAAAAGLYFVHSFQYFESGFFVNHPKINIYFFFSVTVIQAIYSWFLYESVKPDVEKKILSDLKKFAIGVSAGALVILIVAVFNFQTGVMFNDIFTAINSIFIIAIIFLLYQRVSVRVKIIFIGSLFLIAGGVLAIATNLRNEVSLQTYYFQAGFFIELIFFTVAINYMYQHERLAKLKVEIKNTMLINEQLNKEKEAQKLQAQIDMRERDLAFKAVAISQKEALIKNVSSQLKEHVYNNSVKIKDIKKVISDLNLKTDNNFWTEFEAHFINVHPEFYNSLNSLYPGLTTNERRLCAFIKLNLTTKEIANITKRNQGSIHMARTRLRKKIGLGQSENLENTISAIN